MRRNRFLVLLPLLLFFLACENENLGSLAEQLSGTYLGEVSLDLGTDSVRTFPGQRIEFSADGEERALLRALTYPEGSPLDSLSLPVALSGTPNGPIRTEGVMLTILPLSQGSLEVEGFPYLSAGGGLPGQHGLYNREDGSLIFVVEIDRGGGLVEYELFEGRRE